MHDCVVFAYFNGFVHVLVFLSDGIPIQNPKEEAAIRCVQSGHAVATVTTAGQQLTQGKMLHCVLLMSSIRALACKDFHVWKSAWVVKSLVLSKQSLFCTFLMCFSKQMQWGSVTHNGRASHKSTFTNGNTFAKHNQRGETVR